MELRNQHFFLINLFYNPIYLFGTKKKFEIEFNFHLIFETDELH